MKKFIITSILALSFCTAVFAQKLTDNQVLEIIRTEVQAGSSQSQIATKLMQRGATVQQVRRLRDQYERQQNNSNGIATSVQPSREASTVGAIVPETVDPNATIESELSDYNLELAGDSLTNTKRIFGHDIFNRRLLSFDPGQNITAPQSYLLGPGDRVTIDIYGASQRTVTETIARDGSITIPDYGPIALGGLTVSQAKVALKDQLGSRYVSSEIRLTVDGNRTIAVNVVGEVRVPGTYVISSFASVFYALHMAGGITDLGTLRDVRVYRKNKLVSSVDLYDYILNGRLTGDVTLHDQDLILVGTYSNLVDVAGKVKRPMLYEMRVSETLGTAIDYAGGFAGDAYKNTVRVVRKTGENLSVFNVDEFDLKSFKIADGDSIAVDGIINRYSNMVEARGALFRPGMYQLGGNVLTVKGLVEQAGGIMENAFADHALIHRMKEDRTLETLSIDLNGILSGKRPDVPLKNEDLLFVPTMSDRLDARKLTITGSVMFPGDYVYTEGMSVEDLILQAGGLKDEASVARVDVSRIINDPKATETGHRIGESFSFSLKDGLVADGDKGFTLQPYDVVHVRRSPGYYTPRLIAVEGEVLFEGQHTMEVKATRLSDAIRMAGGLTNDAYAKGAILMRQMNDDERRLQERVLDTTKNSTSNDTVSVDMVELESEYSVGIELDKALANPGGPNDIVLREGDRLIVPEYNNTVRIAGDVMYQNVVAYSEGKDYKWYVNNAGGFGHRAKKSKTYIVYMNGMVTKVGRGAKVEPGCAIVVPTKPEPRGGGIQQWLSIGTSLTSMAAMIATLVNVFKK
ncbi:MAG: capsule biosynthesis protein [Bacteroidaceae bacterium]|jgi:protein involved in polysaccharide export with SLBB domain|nr:capsule biosynthesis protein [Bacteroidaceae bacterium]